MIPNTSAMELDDEDIEDLEETEIPTKTYRLNPDTNHIESMIDGVEALKQAIYKICSTELEEHLIYGFDYGVGFVDLIGTDFEYAKAKAMDTIEQGILKDDRFDSVIFTNDYKEKNKLILEFTVITTEGIQLDMEGVEINV